VAAAAAAEPAEVLARVASLEEFRRMLEERVGGYVEKRVLLEKLKERLSKIEALEEKLIAREKLKDAEQAFYDSQGGGTDALREKVSLVTSELQEIVDQGRLSVNERGQCLEQLDGKIASLDKELKKAKLEGKAKLQQKVEEQLQKLQDMRAGVAAAPPFPVALRHGSEIKNLREKLAALKKLEKYRASGTMNISEQEFKRRMRDKPELEEAIQILEDKNRRWFETEEQFQRRLTQGLFDLNSAAIQRKEQESRGATILNRGGSQEERSNTSNGKENHQENGSSRKNHQQVDEQVEKEPQPQSSESFDQWMQRHAQTSRGDDDEVEVEVSSVFRPAARHGAVAGGANGTGTSTSKPAPKPKQKKWAKLDVFGEAAPEAARAEEASAADPEPSPQESPRSQEEDDREAAQTAAPMPAAPQAMKPKKEKESKPAQPPPKPKAKRQFQKLDVFG
jgi:hypothetical protein